MIIFNTTYHVEEQILDEFLNYLKTEFVPAAIESQELKAPRMTRVLSQEQTNGHSFALQFEINELDGLDDWYNQTGEALNEEMISRFGEKVVGFSTLMEVVEL